jgi:hypothetical protein
VERGGVKRQLPENITGIRRGLSRPHEAIRTEGGCTDGPSREEAGVQRGLTEDWEIEFFKKCEARHRGIKFASLYTALTVFAKN